MAVSPVTLSDAIEEFLAYRKTAGFRTNTILINARGLSIFLREVGNVQIRHLDARHGEMFQAYLMGQGVQAQHGQLAPDHPVSFHQVVAVPALPCGRFGPHRQHQGRQGHGGTADPCRTQGLRCVP